MGLHQYSDEHEKGSYYSYVPKKYPCYQDYDHKSYDSKVDCECRDYHKEEYDKKDHDCDKDFCDSESARALKRILSLIDELNNQDLQTLDEIIERLLCSRKHPVVY